MADANAKKALRGKYDEREIVGGVFAIKNTLNNKLLLDATTDLRGIKNRFDFAQKTGSCVHMKLQEDWNKQGGAQFIFEVLEEIVKNEGQTAGEFKADVDLLKAMWVDKMSDRAFY